MNKRIHARALRGRCEAAARLQQFGETQAEQTQGSNAQHLATVHGGTGEMSFAGPMHFHVCFTPVLRYFCYNRMIPNRQRRNIVDGLAALLLSRR